MALVVVVGCQGAAPTPAPAHTVASSSGAEPGPLHAAAAPPTVHDGAPLGPVQDAAPPAPAAPTPARLAKLRNMEKPVCTALGKCGGEDGPDEICAGKVVAPINAWIRDATWRRTFDPDQIAEAETILARIRSCFQAAIGDPLPRNWKPEP